MFFRACELELRAVVNGAPGALQSREAGPPRTAGSSLISRTKPTKSEPDLPYGRRVRILCFLQESVFLQWCAAPSRIQAKRTKKEEIKMIGGIGDEKLIFCKFNMDTACVEPRYTDGLMISIDCTEVEFEVTHTVKHRAFLDYLIYNAPLEYAESVLSGDIETLLQLS